MDFDTAFLKSDICDWADEVDREFSVAGTEKQFSQCSQDTWLYYSTSSSQPFDELRSRHGDRSNRRSSHKSATKLRLPKGSRSARPPESVSSKNSLPTPSEPGAMGTMRAQVVAMVQSRRRDFESCAVSHAWASNFEEHRKKHQTTNATKSVAPPKTSSKEKQRKVVCQQVMDGAVLVVTRKAKAPVKAPAAATPIKKDKKLKKLPAPSPTLSRSSRADSSRDWKSDKKPVFDCDVRTFQITPSSTSSKRSKASTKRETNRIQEWTAARDK